jgi:hypothetical protein
MNHKTLVQEALDGNVSLVESCEMILNEIDSLKSSFDQIVKGAIKEHEQNSQSRFPAQLEMIDRVKMMADKLESSGISLEHFGVKTDVRQSRWPAKMELPSSIFIQNSSISSDLYFSICRGVYENYLKL